MGAYKDGLGLRFDQQNDLNLNSGRVPRKAVPAATLTHVNHEPSLIPSLNEMIPIPLSGIGRHFTV